MDTRKIERHAKVIGMMENSLGNIDAGGNVPIKIGFERELDGSCMLDIDISELGPKEKDQENRKKILDILKDSIKYHKSEIIRLAKEE